MSTLVRDGTSPFVAPLFTFSFPYSTVAAEEPNVGDVVSLKADGSVKKTDTDFDKAVLGVVLTKDTSAKVVGVCMHGIVRVTAAATINAGDVVGGAAGGKVRTIPNASVTYASAEVDRLRGILGKALTSAAAANDPVIIALEVV